MEQLLTGYRGGHGSALNTGAEWSCPLPGESLDSDVVGGVGLQTLDGHLRFCGTIGAVALAVDISIHHYVLDNLSVPISQRRRLPGQVGRGDAQARHTQILGVAARNIFGGANLLHVLLPTAGSVSGTEFEDVGRPLVETSNSKMIIGVSEVFGKKSFFFYSLVLQLVSKVLPHYLFGGLPLDQGSISNGGADHHGWFTGNWKT